MSRAGAATQPRRLTARMPLLYARGLPDADRCDLATDNQGWNRNKAVTDYNLSALGARAFEQLIHALALRILGPEVSTFSDAPDGSREALFDGSTRNNTWRGYGIVQVHFKEQTSATAADGRWAFQQLTTELRNFAKRKQSHQSPQYYVFATNARLGASSGGYLDRVSEALESSKELAVLVDYQVWDYDTICRLIDQAPDLRQAYLSWLLPGDVLSEIFGQFRERGSDVRDTLSVYLQKEFLFDAYADLNQARPSPDERVPLSRVFVDLPFDDLQSAVTPSDRPDTRSLFAARCIEWAGRPVGAKGTSAAKSGSGTVPRRVVLVGGPGQGKTTLAQFICQYFRATMLKDRLNALAPEVRDAVETFQALTYLQLLTPPAVPRFPVCVPLHKFARALQQEPHVTSVVSYLAWAIGRGAGRVVAASDVRRWLAGTPWLVVFDGLDEVYGPANRNAVLTAIRQFCEEGEDVDERLFVLVTTRPQGYTDDFSPGRWRHCRLLNLTPQDAMQYARRLVGAAFTDERLRVKVLAYLNQAANGTWISQLMVTPLQIAIVAALVNARGSAAEHRWQLFRDYYDLVYQREVEREIPGAALLSIYRSDVNVIHARVGMALQVQSERTGGAEASLTASEFVDIVVSRLSEEGHAGEQLQELAGQLTLVTTTRLLFLVEVAPERIGFQIRTFQEFMAAEGLMDGTDEQAVSRMRMIAPISSWRNVYLFAAGAIFIHRQHLRDGLYTICHELNSTSTDKVAGESMAGSFLALDLLANSSAPLQPRYGRLFAGEALRLLDVQQDRISERLVEVYRERFSDVYREEIGSRLTPTLGIQRTAWATLLRLIRSGVAWALTMAEREWPSEKSLQAELVALSTRLHGETWVRSKIRDVLPTLPLDVLRLSGPHPTSDQTWEPDWLREAMLIVQGHSPRSFGVRVGWPPLRSVELRLSSVGQELPDRPKAPGLANMPASHPSWVPLIVNAWFLQNPSRQRFTAALERLRPLVFQTGNRWIEGLLAWPLAAALQARRLGIEERELLEEIQDGYLGDATDWLAAETRWRREGVKLRDFEHAHSIAPWPFDASIGQFGFPLLAWNIVDVDAAEGNGLRLDDLINGFEAAAPDAARELLSYELLVQCAYGHYSNAVPLDIFEVASTEVVGLNPDYLRVNINTLESLRWKADERSRAAAVLDRVGRVARLELGDIKRDPATELNRLRALWRSYPERLGLMRLASLFVLAGQDGLDDVQVNLTSITQPDLKRAGVILRAGSIRSRGEEEALTREILDTTSSDVDWFGSVVEVLVTNGSTAALEVLHRLYRELDPTALAARSHITAAQCSVLNRRLSTLSDPVVWTDLGLPPSTGTR